MVRDDMVFMYITAAMLFATGKHVLKKLCNSVRFGKITQRTMARQGYTLTIFKLRVEETQLPDRINIYRSFYWNPNWSIFLTNSENICCDPGIEWLPAFLKRNYRCFL